MNSLVNRLDLAPEAVVIGGFSEGSELLDPTRRALSSDGEYGLFDSVVSESPNVADIQANPELFSALVEGKTLILRSLASIVVSEKYRCFHQKAKGFILLNPVEGQGVGRTALGALKVAGQKDNQEEDPDFIPPFSQGPNELRRHKIVNAGNLFRAAKFSTLNEILQAEQSYNGGPGYFEYDDDEFDFQNTEGNAPQILRANGYDAARFKGKHMAPVYRPDDTARQLTEYLNAA